MPVTMIDHFIAVLMLTRSGPAALVMGAIATGGGATALQAYQMRENAKEGQPLWAVSKRNLGATVVGGAVVLLACAIAAGILGAG